jgi:hypothetical protein
VNRTLATNLGIGGAAAVIATYAAQLAGIELPDAVAQAIAVLAAGLAAHLGTPVDPADA